MSKLGQIGPDEAMMIIGVKEAEIFALRRDTTREIGALKAANQNLEDEVKRLKAIIWPPDPEADPPPAGPPG